MKMQVEVFTAKARLTRRVGGVDAIRNCIGRIADDTDTSDLVVGVYLLENGKTWQGMLDRHKRKPQDFTKGGGRWACAREFGVPDGLPEHYALIRLIYGLDVRYPCERQCRYGWRYEFPRFRDDLAFMAAHELHHFRRHHLGFHPREGEQSAICWGINRMREVGFKMDARRSLTGWQCCSSARRRKLPTGPNLNLLRKIMQMAGHLAYEDLDALRLWATARSIRAHKDWKGYTPTPHTEALRSFPDSSILRISSLARQDSYAGQKAKKVRNLQASPRMEVQTADGKHWRYPMCWLEIPRPSDSEV